jgi:hypothetical protein
MTPIGGNNWQIVEASLVRLDPIEKGDSLTA